MNNMLAQLCLKLAQNAAQKLTKLSNATCHDIFYMIVSLQRLTFPLFG